MYFFPSSCCVFCFAFPCDPVTATGTIDVTSSGAMTMRSTNGGMTLNANGAMTLTSGGSMSLTSGTDVSISASATGASALVLTTPGDASINSDDMAMTYTGALTVSADSVSMTATVGPVSVTSAGAVGLTSATTMDVSAGSILTEEAGTSYSLTVGTSSSMTVGGSGAFTFNEFSMAATGGAAGGIGLTSATTFDASSAGAMTLRGSSVLLKAGAVDVAKAVSTAFIAYEEIIASSGIQVDASGIEIVLGGMTITDGKVPITLNMSKVEVFIDFEIAGGLAVVDDGAHIRSAQAGDTILQVESSSASYTGTVLDVSVSISMCWCSASYRDNDACCIC